MNKIENENQLKITERWIVDFSDSLKKLESEKNSMEPLLYELHFKANQSMIEDFKEQIMVYKEGIRWIDARFGDKWVEHIIKAETPKVIAEIALLNGRARIRLHDSMEKIKSMLNPNNPRETEIYKQACNALSLDKREGE